MPRQQELSLQTRPARAGARSPRPLRALAACVGAYLLSPVLFSQHLEGYTANLRAITLVWERGRLADFDSITPIIVQYLFATRSGIILLLSFVDRAFGHPGDAGFRGLIIASFLLLAASSVLIARRWGRLGIAACVIGFIAIPGLADTGSFFNDNIISAALGMAALAAVSRSGSVPACAASGVLLGAATVCRTDALVLCPAIAGVVWLQHGQLAPLLRRGLACAAGFLLASAVGYALTGTTLIDALHIPGQFVPPRIGIAFRLTIFALFIGVPALVLLGMGVVLNVRRHVVRSFDLRWSLLFLAYPAFILGIAILRLSTEVRYLYPLLAPFYLVHVGRGLEFLLDVLRGQGTPRRLGIAVAGALVLVCVVPPNTFVRDGPHATYGRLWMPLVWFRWQASVANSLRQMDQLAAKADADPQMLVISTQFNDEYFFRLRLLEHGFEARSAESDFPDCRGGFSVYAKPGHRTLHIRTENQYGFVSQVPNVIVRAVQLQRALQCPAAWTFDDAFLAFAGEDVRNSALPLEPMLFSSVLPRMPPVSVLSTTFGLRTILFPDAPVHETPAQALRGESRMADIHVLPLTRPELESIKASADQMMADFNNDGELGPFTYEDFESLYRAR
jgi:hypothetical protein